jgi:glycosyltransferase involved in cell wall biosynthesis
MKIDFLHNAMAEQSNIDNIDGKKILTIVYNASIFDWQGGTAGLKNFLKIFKKFNMCINVLSYNYYSEKTTIKKHYLGNKLFIIDINITKRMPNWSKPFFMMFSGLLLPNLIRNSDRVISEMSIMPALPTTIYCRLFKKDLILHYVDIEHYPIPSIFNKFIIKNAKIVLAISPFLIENAKELGTKNIIYLPPLVDTDLFKVNYIKREEFRKEYGLANDELIIGYAGTFWHEEGLPILLSAFKSLLEQKYKVRLVILGGPKLTTNPKKLTHGAYDDDILDLLDRLAIKDYVIIINPKPHDLVPEILSVCDITSCPKLDTIINQAANPIKVVEYLSMGIPTVCSAVGGIKSLIDDGVNGYLCKPGSISDLEDILKKIISDYNQAVIIGLKGREKAIKEFSFTAHEKLLKDIIH